MKLQRSTAMLLGVAISLVTIVTIVETQKDTQISKGERLYTFTEADISAFTLERDDETLSFTKADNTWQMTEPEKAAAAPSSVAFLLNIITSDSIQETITTTPNQLETYGLDQPTATIQLTVDNENYKLSVGNEDFSGTSLYVMTSHEVVEPNPVDIYLMPKELENGIERSVNEWIAQDENNANDIDGNTDGSQNETIERNAEQDTSNDSDTVPSVEDEANGIDGNTDDSQNETIEENVEQDSINDSDTVPSLEDDTP
ncbi:MAG: DUF4340 domain-containing protein [Leptolyngbyaceae cyanobacterium MAG.088]|nr:DUF4340 domain-containing protein [Leptolyngbyaceae cyanobacterium MAG.088]